MTDNGRDGNEKFETKLDQSDHEMGMPSHHLTCHLFLIKHLDFPILTLLLKYTYVIQFMEAVQVAVQE